MKRYRLFRVLRTGVLGMAFGSEGSTHQVEQGPVTNGMLESFNAAGLSNFLNRPENTGLVWRVETIDVVGNLVGIP